MDRMNYINKDKNHMKQEEWIKYLEESIRELRKEKENLNKEKGILKAELHNTQLLLKAGLDDYMKLEEENKKLKEFKAKQEEMMFLIGASIELAKPKTAGDAENLQKGKEIYEKLYKKELYYLKEENKKLKEELERYKKQYEHSMGEDN